MIGQIIFGLATALTFFFAYRQFSAIYRNIRLGKDEKISGDIGQRIKNTLLIAFGQQKMFHRPLAALLHLFVYVAFLITQLELIEIFIDGLFGQHRFFWYTVPAARGLYTFIISSIEVMSVLALVATFAFLARRNALRLPRFQSPELKGWPKMDANNILYIEIALVTCIFMMNAADMAHSKHLDEGYGFLISGLISPYLEGIADPTLELMERIGWWGHILIVFGFLNYLPHSKHLHIMLAFPNTYFAPLKPKGEMENMPEVQKEVASMFDPEAAFAEPDPNFVMPKFGASDVMDLSWRHILSAYTCTECGRCTSVCPANQTGKTLSPRKVVMDVRDRADVVGKNIAMNNTECINAEQKSETSLLTKHNYDDGKTLYDFITIEELRACTTCTACVDACPVMISPMDIILELRRNLILERSDSPESWNAMFNAVENNAAPWAFSPDDRDKWVIEALEKENQ